jgi:hypothetical protein
MMICRFCKFFSTEVSPSLSPISQPCVSQSISYSLSPSQPHLLTTLIHELTPYREVIDNLNDTRPLVNNREHRTVMAGGSWVYSVLKPLAEKAEEQGEDLDIENVVSDTKTWVDGEYARVRR